MAKVMFRTKGSRLTCWAKAAIVALSLDPSGLIESNRSVVNPIGACTKWRV